MTELERAIDRARDAAAGRGPVLRRDLRALLAELERLRGLANDVRAAEDLRCPPRPAGRAAADPRVAKGPWPMTHHRTLAEVDDDLLSSAREEPPGGETP